MKWLSGTAAIFVLAGILAWVWHQMDVDDSGIQVAQTPRVAEASPDVLPIEETPDSPQTDQIVSNQSQRPPDYLAQIGDLLRRGEYSAAVEIYDRAYPVSKESESAVLAAAILNFARELQQAEKYAQSEMLLLAYLAVFYRDIDALWVLADNYLHQQNPTTELETLLKVFDYAYQTKTIGLVKRRIRNVAANYRQQLKEEQNQSAIIELYQSLIAKFPDESRYYVDLARQYILISEFEEAKQVLAQITDPKIEKIVEKMLVNIEQKQSTELNDNSNDRILVPLTRLNANHFAVRAIINGRTSIRLLIDTGASITVIRPGVLTRVGGNAAQVGRYISLNTANGVTQAPVVTLQRMSIGGQTVANIQVAALDLQGLDQVDGLLGMDFLRQFEFAIHQSRNQLQLSKQN